MEMEETGLTDASISEILQNLSVFRWSMFF